MSIPGLRLDFWNKSFYKETAFGRTLSGRNKTGQALGVVKDTALSIGSLGTIKKLSDATGRITDIVEGDEIGKDVEKLNLSDRAIIIIRTLVFALLATLVITQVIGWDTVLKLTELFNALMPG